MKELLLILSGLILWSLMILGFAEFWFNINIPLNPFFVLYFVLFTISIYLSGILLLGCFENIQTEKSYMLDITMRY